MTRATYIDTEPYWAAAAERRLVLQYCPVAQRFQHPPRPVSVYTGSRELAWREVAGRGRIYAMSTLHVQGGVMRYATIELDEGVRLIGRLLGEADRAHIGARVVLAWDQLADGRLVPAFAVDPDE